MATGPNDLRTTCGPSKREIARLPGIEKLKNRPVIWNEEVGDKIAKQFAEKSKIPTLAFIDPWGYKGLTLRLVDAFLRDWGCDCIFFFNYARINAGLSNPMVREHMGALFGAEKAEALSRVLEPLGPAAREATIVEALSQALKGYGHRFVLPFCFKSDAGTRTKHHLILVTKHFRGYAVMKDIMVTASSTREQGVPSFSYSPADSSAQQLLFELNRPLDELRARLLRDFAGQTVTMRAIYEKHSVDRAYLAKNHKDVLTAMESDGAIKTSGRNPSGASRTTSSSSSRTEGADGTRVRNRVDGVHVEPSYGVRQDQPRLQILLRRAHGGAAPGHGPAELQERLRPDAPTPDAGAAADVEEAADDFVNSMSDLFHEDVPLSFIKQVFDVMRRAHWHRFQVLTKRASRLATLDKDLTWASNIWMGVSVESARYVDRIDDLRRTGAQVKFLSLEPLLSPLSDLDLRFIDWAIVGGESGPRARAMSPAWVIEIPQPMQGGRGALLLQAVGGQEQEEGRAAAGRTNLGRDARFADCVGSRRSLLASPFRASCRSS